MAKRTYLGVIALVAVLAGCGSSGGQTSSREGQQTSTTEAAATTTTERTTTTEATTTTTEPSPLDDVVSAVGSPTWSTSAHITFQNQEGYTFEADVAVAIAQPRKVIENSPPGTAQVGVEGAAEIRMTNTTAGRPVEIFYSDVDLLLSNTRGLGDELGRCTDFPASYPAGACDSLIQFLPGLDSNNDNGMAPTPPNVPVVMKDGPSTVISHGNFKETTADDILSRLRDPSSIAGLQIVFRTGTFGDDSIHVYTDANGAVVPA